MEDVTLYNLLESGILQTWKDEASANDDCGFTANANELRQELTVRLDDNGKKLLHSYIIAIENKLDYFYHLVSIKILNFGVKIGMELQKAFTEYEG